MSTSNLIKFVFIAIVFGIFSIQTSEGFNSCKPGFYFDTNTGNCDPCDDICEQAEQQRTIERCLTLCPGFQIQREVRLVECPRQFYYDSGTNRCEPCRKLCRHAKSRGPEKECRKQCPRSSGFVRISDTSTLHSDEERSTTSSRQNTSTESTQSTLSTSLLVGMLLIFFVVVALCACFWKRDFLFRMMKSLCLCSVLRNKKHSHQVQTPEADPKYIYCEVPSGIVASLIRGTQV